MLFGGKRGSSRRHSVAVVRDIVEVTAIVVAGIWAFYIFAYENRIKPSMADPDVNVTASMQRLSERNGFIAVGLHLELHNVGTVRAHFLGMAVNVYGQRISPAKPARFQTKPGACRTSFEGFYRSGAVDSGLQLGLRYLVGESGDQARFVSRPGKHDRKRSHILRTAREIRASDPRHRRSLYERRKRYDSDAFGGDARRRQSRRHSLSESRPVQHRTGDFARRSLASRATRSVRRNEQDRYSRR